MNIMTRYFISVKPANDTFYLGKENTIISKNEYPTLQQLREAGFESAFKVNEAIKIWKEKDCEGKIFKVEFRQNDIEKSTFTSFEYGEDEFSRNAEKLEFSELINDIPIEEYSFTNVIY